MVMKQMACLKKEFKQLVNVNLKFKRETWISYQLYAENEVMQLMWKHIDIGTIAHFACRKPSTDPSPNVFIKLSKQHVLVFKCLDEFNFVEGQEHCKVPTDSALQEIWRMTNTCFDTDFCLPMKITLVLVVQDLKNVPYEYQNKSSILVHMKSSMDIVYLTSQGVSNLLGENNITQLKQEKDARQRRTR